MNASVTTLELRIQAIDLVDHIHPLNNFLFKNNVHTFYRPTIGVSLF